jgi:branched-chain amino acid transport system ATP-binding protein
MDFLKVEKLTKYFGALSAVHEFSTTLREGERRAIIGPNGAGKTTFFNLLTGLFHPTSGKIFFGGEIISGLKPFQIVQKGIARSFQKNNIFDGLTVFENVLVSLLSLKGRSFDFINSYLKDFHHRERVFFLLDQVRLSEEADRKVGEISHGKKRHLEIAIALALDPKLLLLDEPTSGMPPEETFETMNLIRKLTEGKTTIFIEHDMNVVFTIADRITVMHQGTALAEGPPEEIRMNEEVKKAYLGISE